MNFLPVLKRHPLLLGMLLPLPVLLLGQESCSTADLDDDGYTIEDGDCDDFDPMSYPGAPEVCDDMDNDCDGSVDEDLDQMWYADQDGDGHGDPDDVKESCAQPNGYVSTADDCNDEDATVYPDAPELCDGIDNNCNQSADENPERLLFPDDDGDGYGRSGEGVSTCDTLPGHAERDGDCDDADPTIHPDQKDTCDGVDSDCNGAVDDAPDTIFAPDLDGDGQGDTFNALAACPGSPELSADIPWVTTFGDCDDSNPAIAAGTPDLCDGLDNDCDGRIDEGIPFYIDLDQDGFGDSATRVSACSAPIGYVETTGDCDDTRSDIHPAADDPEGDGIDQDCGGFDGPQPSLGFESSRYSSLQEALAATPSGATLWLGPGSYPADGLVLTNHPLSIRSTHGASHTLLEATSGHPAFTITESPDHPTRLADLSLSGGRTQEGGALLIRNALVQLDNVTLYGNRADNTGGAIAALDDTILELNNIVSTGNLLVNPTSDYAAGAGLYLYESETEIHDSAFTFNQAAIGASLGAGLYLEWSSADIDGSRFVGNQAVGSAGFGGGIYILDATLTLSNSRVEGNYASYYGGGIGAERADIELSASTIEANTAELYGGGLSFLAAVEGELSSLLIQDNEVFAGGGGGIALSTSSPSIHNCRIENNRSGSGLGGGGILAYASRPAIDNTRIVGNWSTSAGGGIALYGESDATLTNLLVADNGTDGEGGGIRIDFSSPSIDAAVLADNTATAGGGIYVVYDSSPRMIRSILAYNDGYNYYLEGVQSGPSVEECDLYNPDDQPNHNANALDASNVEIDPEFLGHREGEAIDYHLSLASPLIDFSANAADADGSAADLGIYGGPGGDRWDLDADQSPAYFWPGTFEDAPSSVDPAGYDCNDLDSSVSGASCG